MRRGFVLLALLVLLLCSCSPSLPKATTPPPPDIEAEEYAIYSALIRQNPIGYDLGSSFVIREQTAADLDTCEFRLEDVCKLPASLVNSYRARNAASYTLSPALDVEQGYAMMSQEEFTQIFRSTGLAWTRFKSRYPDVEGMVTFSRVGFNAKGDHALVLFGFRCGELCGAGGTYLLVKENGNWTVQETLMAWQS